MSPLPKSLLVLLNSPERFIPMWYLTSAAQQPQVSDVIIHTSHCPSYFQQWGRPLQPAKRLHYFSPKDCCYKSLLLSRWIKDHWESIMWRPASVRQRRWTSCSSFIQCSVGTSKYVVTDLMRASDREGQMLQSAVGLSGFFFFPSFKDILQWNVPNCHHLLSHSTRQACNEGVEPHFEMNVLIHWRGGNCALIDLQQLRGTSKPVVEYLRCN